MVKVSQNLWKESYHNIFVPDSLGSSWLWGSNSCLPSSQAGFNSRHGKGFFHIGMIIKLPLSSIYPNTVYWVLLSTTRSSLEFFEVPYAFLKSSWSSFSTLELKSLETYLPVSLWISKPIEAFYSPLELLSRVCWLRQNLNNIWNFHIPPVNSLKVSHCFLSLCQNWHKLRKSYQIMADFLINLLEECGNFRYCWDFVSVNIL